MDADDKKILRTMDADDEKNDDDTSIISIKDSDSAYSFTTLIEDETTVTTKSTNQLNHLNQAHVCDLFLSHFKDGVTRHVAKKLYVAGLKEKPSDSPTILFEKKENDNKERNLDESLKRKTTFNVPVVAKRKCHDEIKDRRKTLHTSPKAGSSRLTKRSISTHPTANLNSHLKNAQVATPSQHITPTTSNKSALIVSQPPSSTRTSQQPSSPNRPSVTPSTSKKESSTSQRLTSNDRPPSSDEKRKNVPSSDEKRKNVPSSDEKRKNVPSSDEKRKHVPSSDEKRKRPSNSNEGHSSSTKRHRGPSVSSRRSTSSPHGASHPKDGAHRSSTSSQRNSSESKHRSKHHDNPKPEASTTTIPKQETKPTTIPKPESTPTIIPKPESTPTIIPEHVLDVARNMNISKRDVQKLNSSLRNVCGNSSSLQEIDMFSGETLTSPVAKIKSNWSPNIQIGKLKASPNHDDANNNQPIETIAMSTSNNEITKPKPKSKSHHGDANNNQVKLLPGNNKSEHTANTPSSNSKMEPKSVSNPFIPKISTKDSNIVKSNEPASSGECKSQIQCKIDYLAVPERLPRLMLDPLNVSREKQIIHDSDGSYAVRFRSDLKRCKIQKCVKEGRKIVRTSDEQERQDDCAQPSDSQGKTHIIRDLSRPKNTNDTVAQTKHFSCQTDADDTVKHLSEEHASNIKEKEEKIKKQAFTIEENEKMMKKQVSTIEEKDRKIEKQASTIEDKDRMIEKQASTIEEKDRKIEKQAAAIENKEKIIKKQSSTIEEKAKQIEEQAILIKDYNEKNQRQTEDYEKRIAEQALTIKNLERKMKESDETNKCLKNKESELYQNVKEHDRIVEELKQKNAEEVQNLADKVTSYEIKLKEQDDQIKEQEEQFQVQFEEIEGQKQQIVEQAQEIRNHQLKYAEQSNMITSQSNMIASQLDAIDRLDVSLNTLIASERTCVALMREHEAYCKENHVDKPKPRKPRQPRRKSAVPPAQLSPPAQSQSPNMAYGSQSVQQQSFNITENALSHHHQYSPLRLVDIGKLKQNLPVMNLSPSACHLSNPSHLLSSLTSPANTPRPPSIASTSSAAVNTTTPNINVPVLITTPANQWTVEASMPISPMPISNQTQEQMYNGIPSTSTSTHVHPATLNYAQTQMYSGIPSTSSQINSAAVNTAISRNSIPHLLLPRQPQRTLSMSLSKPNTFVTIQPQSADGNSLYHPDSCSAQNDVISNQSNQMSSFGDQNWTIQRQQQSQQFSSRLQNRSQTVVYTQQSQNNIQMRMERLHRAYQLQQFQNQPQQFQNHPQHFQNQPQQFQNHPQQFQNQPQQYQPHQFQNQTQQLSHMQQGQERQLEGQSQVEGQSQLEGQSQEGQSQLEGQLQDYKSAQQRSYEQQALFYCLACNKTAKIVCKTCRNCCSCSDFCYDLLAAKHKSQCKLPVMVTIKEILNK